MDRQNDYHHFQLTFAPAEVGERFKDVRFVLVAGCPQRAHAMAAHLAERGAGAARPLTGAHSRFVLIHVGRALVANHGMGPASMSIAVHELLHMCQAAGIVSRVTVIRFGTCGGLGVAPGTLCVTSKAVDSLLQDYVELKVCLRTVRRPCTMDERTCRALLECAQRVAADGAGHAYEVRAGATLSTGDFYEEQGRLNGAICEHSAEDKRRFLAAAAQFGVVNMEMESTHLAAMCAKLGVKFAVLCVALNNRLLSDRVELTHEQQQLYERRLFRTIGQYMAEQLAGRP